MAEKYYVEAIRLSEFLIATKNRQIEELQVLYETEQKTRDIKTLQDKEKIQQIKLEQA